MKVSITFLNGRAFGVVFPPQGLGLLLGFFAITFYR